VRIRAVDEHERALGAVVEKRLTIGVCPACRISPTSSAADSSPASNRADRRPPAEIVGLTTNGRSGGANDSSGPTNAVGTTGTPAAPRVLR
jgi:hypothetical protein